MIQELPEDQVAPARPVASDQMEQEILTQPPIAEVQANDQRQGNPVQDYERRFEKLPEDQKLSKLCSEACLNLVEVGQLFCALPSPNGAKNRDEKENCAKEWIESDARFGPVSDIKVCKTYRRYNVEVKSSIFFRRQNHFLDQNCERS